MTDIQIIEEHGIQPFKQFGLEHPFFTINTVIVLHTWLLLGLLAGILLIARYCLTRKNNVFGFLVHRFAENFMNMVEQNLGFFSYRHCLFITSLFIFILLCNIASLIPFVEEPTKNINTTLALGIISFLYIQYNAIKAHGLLNYIKEFFMPFFILFPINVIGELATIISLSFRLFGNIFGGWIISTIYHGALSGSALWEVLGLISGFNLVIQLFFGLFEGLIQAFVFSMLALTYLSLAVSKED